MMGLESHAKSNIRMESGDIGEVDVPKKATLDPNSGSVEEKSKRLLPQT